MGRNDAIPTDEQIDGYLCEPLTRLGFEQIQTGRYRWPDGPDPDVEIELRIEEHGTADIRRIHATIWLRHEILDQLDRKVREGVKAVDVSPPGRLAVYPPGYLVPDSWFGENIYRRLISNGFSEGQSPRRAERSVLRDIRRVVPWIRDSATFEFIASDYLSRYPLGEGFDEYSYRAALALHLLGRSAEAVDYLEEYLRNPRGTMYYGGNTFRGWARNLLKLIEAGGYPLPAERRSVFEGLLAVTHTPEKEAQLVANHLAAQEANNKALAAMAAVVEEYLAPRGYERLPRTRYIWARETESHISVVELFHHMSELSVGAWPKRLGDKPPGWPEPYALWLPIGYSMDVLLPLCLQLNLRRALSVLERGAEYDKIVIEDTLESFHGPWLRRARRCIFEPYEPPSTDHHEAILRRAMADYICPFLDRIDRSPIYRRLHEAPGKWLVDLWSTVTKVGIY